MGEQASSETYAAEGSERAGDARNAAHRARESADLAYVAAVAAAHRANQLRESAHAQRRRAEAIREHVGDRTDNRSKVCPYPPDTSGVPTPPRKTPRHDG